MLFKKSSYILELDTEIFKGEMTMSEICFKYYERGGNDGIVKWDMLDYEFITVEIGDGYIGQIVYYISCSILCMFKISHIKKL